MQEILQRPIHCSFIGPLYRPKSCMRCCLRQPRHIDTRQHKCTTFREGASSPHFLRLQQHTAPKGPTSWASRTLNLSPSSQRFMLSFSYERLGTQTGGFPQPRSRCSPTFPSRRRCCHRFRLRRRLRIPFPSSHCVTLESCEHG